MEDRSTYSVLPQVSVWWKCMKTNAQVHEDAGQARHRRSVGRNHLLVGIVFSEEKNEDWHMLEIQMEKVINMNNIITLVKIVWNPNELN